MRKPTGLIFSEMPTRLALRLRAYELVRSAGRLLDGFDGKLTTSKYAQLAKCSTDPRFAIFSDCRIQAYSFTMVEAVARQATGSQRLTNSHGRRAGTRYLPRALIFNFTLPQAGE